MFIVAYVSASIYHKTIYFNMWHQDVVYTIFATTVVCIYIATLIISMLKIAENITNDLDK